MALASLYENGSETGNQWTVSQTPISNPDNYQLVGGYYNADSFYLVYQGSSIIYGYNPYESNPAMMSLGAISTPPTTPGARLICT